jgi:hypothetical protein
MSRPHVSSRCDNDLGAIGHWLGSAVEGRRGFASAEPSHHIDHQENH